MGLPKEPGISWMEGRCVVSGGQAPVESFWLTHKPCPTSLNRVPAGFPQSIHISYQLCKNAPTLNPSLQPTNCSEVC